MNPPKSQVFPHQAPASLQGLVAEIRRAERLDLALRPFWMVTAFWLPRERVLINLIFATPFHPPCLWLRRFNRLLLLGSLEAAQQWVCPTAGGGG